MNSLWIKSAGALALSVGLIAAACSRSESEQADADPRAGQAPQATYTIGVIAKSNANPVFQAARTGAEAAGRRLSDELGVNVRVQWRTPPQEDAQLQAQYVEQLIAAGVNGIAISVTDANILNSVLRRAVDRGIVVVTFDSDAPDSGRMAYYGVDDTQAGKEVMRQLATIMGGEGTVAVLTGNPAAVNLSNRVRGVRAAAAEFPGITIKDVYNFTPETATEAAARMQQVQTANPDITGWALVGGWPLYTDNALDGIYQNARVVSMDPLPLPLEYVRRGQVQVLVGQPYFGWGEVSVEMIVNKLHYDRDPESEFVFANFDIVTGDNVDEFAENWKTWLGDN
ncbi:MAG: substrate-binding domain-containing protein [Phycisphaerales bacterium]|nr:substrate-binding domain-containing protein [Planctomycetota bacterium]MCH8508703.1 substrate-binding domain-containing protein [Phycisphaerales bacterium]